MAWPDTIKALGGRGQPSSPVEAGSYGPDETVTSMSGEGTRLPAAGVGPPCFGPNKFSFLAYDGNQSGCRRMYCPIELTEW